MKSIMRLREKVHWSCLRNIEKLTETKIEKYKS
jgi:hypothetical protein